MTRKIEYTRTEAEFLLELLEQDGRGMALNLADDVRETFGMPPRTSEGDSVAPATRSEFAISRQGDRWMLTVEGIELNAEVVAQLVSKLNDAAVASAPWPIYEESQR